MSTTDLQVWARSEDVAATGAVARALWEERSLVRTWAMRGTLALLTPEQLGLLASAFDPSTHYTPVWFKSFEVTRDELERLHEALGRALEDGEPRTRRELAESVTALVGQRLGARLESGWGELLKPAARRGLLVNGPPRGQQTTYVRTDRWLADGAVPRLDPDAARTELLRRYLRAYGPATREDYGRWLGTRLAGPFTRALAALGPEVVEVRRAGRRLHALAADQEALTARPEPDPTPVRLLPGFDPYVLGHANRDHLLGAAHRPLVYRTAGWISPTVLAAGRVVGTWTHAVEGGRAAVRISPFEPLDAVRRAGLQVEAERLAALLAMPAELYT